MANNQRPQQNNDSFTPYVPNSASNPYLDQENSSYEQNPYARQTTARGYVPPAANPYMDGPTTGAEGFSPEEVKNRAKKKRRKKNAPGQGLPGQQRKRRRRTPFIVVLIVLIAIFGGVGYYLWNYPPYYNVTINGIQRFVKSGMTIQQAIGQGYAAPVAGDLLAIDGTVWTAGAGEAFSATVNGETTTDPNYVLTRDAEVQISDGADITEDYTETTETVAHGTSGTSINSFNQYWAGSIHVYSEGEDGEALVKTGNQSGVTITEITKQPKDSGYSVYTVDTGDDKVIALTFDDGPWEKTTEEILDVLAENGAKATFFQIGNQCASYPTIEKRIISEGHQIATHTYDHAAGSGGGVDLTQMSSSEQISEVTKGFSAIESATGTTVSRIMRAPGGNYYGSIITTLKDYIDAEIGWDVDTEDWRKPGAEAIAERILSAKSGDVVLMHDGGGDRTQTVEALKTALPQLKEQGYKFVTIDELLEYANPTADSSTDSE